MKTKFLPILMLLLTVVGLSSAKAQTVIYSWDDGDEIGGKATSAEPKDIGFNSSGTYGYTTLRLQGKSDYSTINVTITLDKALAGGEKISVTAFRSKNDVDKQSGFKAKFDKGGEVSSSTGLEFVNIDQSDASAGDSNRGTEPNTCEFTVPAEAAGSTVITMTRSHAKTNLYIDKLVITTSEGDEPVEPVVTIAKPTFEIDGVTYESGATVPGVKTGQRININVEEGMWIYTNWSGKTGKKVEDLHKANNAPKGQTTCGVSTSSGGQRVLSAVAGDTQDASGHASDIAYVILSDVVASEPTFSPAAGEVELGTVVTLTAGCKDDKLYYTTDGSDPTAESTAYTEAGITVDKDVTIKAIAFDKNSQYGSAIVTAAYTVPVPVVIPTPAFTPASGSTIAYGGEVTITYDEGYTLYYTTDGSDPKTSDTVQPGFNNPETIIAEKEGTLTIKAFLSNKDGDGEVVTATYTVEGKPIVVGVPTFDPAPGAVVKGTQVHIIFGENAKSVSFTTDGSDPRTADAWTSSKLIDAMSPIIINEETTIKAICQAQEGGKTYSSEIVTVTYTIKEEEVLPESNVTFDPEGAMPTTFDGWDDNFLIKKTDTKAGDKFTFITQPVEVEGWQFGPQILPKSNADWTDLCNALIPNSEGKAVLELTKDMADIINANGGLRIQGMGIKVLAVQFEAGPDEPIVEPDYEGIVLWKGKAVVKGWADQPYVLSDGAKELKDAGAQVGDVLRFYMTAPDDNWQVELIDGHWKDTYMFVRWSAHDLGNNSDGTPRESVITDLKDKGYAEVEITQEMLDRAIIEPQGWGGGFVLNGDGNVTCTAVTLIKNDAPAPDFALTFDPKDGTEVEVDDVITMSFDGDAFNCYYTTDGSDPRTSMTMMTAMPVEFITVKGEGEFVITAVLENRKTDAMSQLFVVKYTIKANEPIEPEPEFATIVTKANGYGTFCCDKDLDFSASDAKAYIGRLDGNKIYLTEIEQVPAGTGILVQSGAEECTVPVMEGAIPVNSKNDFIGVLEDTEVAYGTVSILSVVNGEEGFYKFLGTTIPANRAYFPAVAAGSAQAKLSFIFEDADGIGQIVSNAIVNGDAYNLNGQRVKSNYKGVVIVNGKKFFKK